MRDITKKGFNSNSPMKNYYNLQEQIDILKTRIRKIEEAMIELIVVKR